MKPSGGEDVQNLHWEEPAEAPFRKSRGRFSWRQIGLVLEILIVFVGLPTAYRLGWIGLPLIGAIVLLALTAALVLFLDSNFDRGRLWRRSALRQEAPRIAALFGAAAILGAATVLILAPDDLFSFVRSRTGVWLMVMVLYPILSVYPQEIVFRGFFFHRYGPLFRRPWALILASALVFGYVHIVMGNALAMILSTIGGVFFGWTYLRTRSLLAVAVEHALYGCFIFTIGLGEFFYLAPS